MLFARVKINNDNSYEVLEWPISENTLRARMGNTIFPGKINEVTLHGTDFVIVPASTPEEMGDIKPDATHRVEPDTIIRNSDDTWKRTWKLVELTDVDEIQARLDRKWKEVRDKRDKLMEKNDWRVLRNNREVRLGLTPTESIIDIDTEQNKLANITINYIDPFLIDWDNLIE